jgi:hypothetical protein
VKDKTGDLLADSHQFLNRWKNYYSQLLNEHRFSDVRQIEIHTAESLVPDPISFEVEICSANLKKCNSPGTDQISVEQIQTGSKILWTEIHKLVNSIWNKKELPD